MLFVDWLSAFVRRTRVEPPWESERGVARTEQTSGTAESGRSAAVPSRSWGLGLLPALIARYAASLDRARCHPTQGYRAWSDIEKDVRLALAACAPHAPFSQVNETLREHVEWSDAWLTSIDQAAFVLSAGAWSAGQDYRLMHPADVSRWLSTSGSVDRPIPVEARRAIEPAIRFGYGLYRTLQDLAKTHRPEPLDHDAQARAMYRTLARAAHASCRAGLAYEDPGSDRSPG